MVPQVAENHPITELPSMNSTQRRIGRLMAQGITPSEIADYLGFTESTVRNYALDSKSRDMVDYLDVVKRKQNVLDRDTFDDLQSKAIQTYEQVLENGTTDQKLRVSGQILDRHPDGMFTKSSKLKHESAAVVTNDTIMELKRRARIVDAEVIDLLPSSGSLSTDPAGDALALPSDTPERPHPIEEIEV